MRGRARRTLIAAGLVAIGGVVAAQEVSRSVWDGVYTDAQADRGRAIYLQHCQRCHGATLMGGGAGAGPLQGAVFSSNWNGVPLGAMLDRVRTTMPQDKPMTLSRQQIADVLAYVFSVNKFPSGKTELSRQTEILNTIAFKATK